MTCECFFSIIASAGYLFSGLLLGQRVLLVDGAQKHSRCPEILLQLRRIHASRLHRIEHVQADLDQLGMMG